MMRQDQQLRALRPEEICKVITPSAGRALLQADTGTPDDEHNLLGGARV